ncbi:MAG: hypothetical protein ABL949_05385 [Fimbriimonadaceae bacterium]
MGDEPQPALPTFLKKFESQTVLKEQRRYRNTWVSLAYRVDVPAEKVTLSLADEVGDKNVYIGPGFAECSMASYEARLTAVIHQGRRQTIVHFSQNTKAVPFPTSLVVKLLPSFNINSSGRSLDIMGDDEFDKSLTLQSIRKIRPNVRDLPPNIYYIPKAKLAKTSPKP